MKLQPAQHKHFYHIFYPFLDFAIRHLTERGLFTVPDFNPENVRAEDLQAVLDAIWGEGGHLEVIDAIVDDPQLPLNRTDRRVVSSWREGIYDTFAACRQGPDTIFVTGDYVFCVRGITDEIDETALVFPAFIKTVIVPFDGIITYLVFLMNDAVEFSDDLNAATHAAVQEAKELGYFIRSARQFEKVASDARAKRHHGSQDAHAREERAVRAGDGSTGEHRGVLAGLTWEERTRRVEEAAKNEASRTGSSLMSTLISRHCLTGRPQDSEAKVIAKYGVSTLRGLAKARGVVDNLTRQDLIDYFLKEYPPDAEKTLADLHMLGLPYLRGMRKLVESKGRLHVRLDGTTPTEDIPHPVFPWISYYRETGGYVAASPCEIIRALEGTDWDAELERGERFDKALAWLAVAVDMRGVIEADEALRSLAERYPDVDIAEVKEAARRRSNKALISIVVGTVDDREYFAAIDLYDSGMDALVTDGVRDILTQRRDIPPYWPTEEEGRYGILGASLNEPAVRAFIQYFDEHVPDDEEGLNDLNYADLTWSAFALKIRVLADMTPEITRFVNIFGDSPEGVRRILDLLLPALETLPMRSLNGHSYTRYNNEVAPDKNSHLVYKR